MGVHGAEHIRVTMLLGLAHAFASHVLALFPVNSRPDHSFNLLFDAVFEAKNVIEQGVGEEGVRCELHLDGDHARFLGLLDVD